MGLPGDLGTCVLTGTFLDPAGNPMRGTVTIVPNATLTDATGNVIVPQLHRHYQLFNGSFATPPLVGTDNTDINPSGWTYQITIALQEVEPYQFNIALPASGSPVDLSTLSPAQSIPQLAGALPVTGGTLTGKLTLTGSVPLQIPAGAAAGDVLTSDASGNASWGPGSSVTLSQLDGRYANVFSPMAYGAVGDGSTIDTAALQACAAAAVAVKGVIDLGTRTFKTDAPINITTGFHMKGAGYQGGTITSSTSDIFTFASSVSYVTFEGCNFTSNTGGGHIWNGSNGPFMSFWKILGCVMTQNNNGKAIWYQDRGGWIDCLVDQNCNLICATGATVSPWTMINCPGNINSVKFSRSRCLSAGATVPFFNIDPGYSAHTDTVTISTGTPNTVSDTSAVSGDLGFLIYSTAYPASASLITAVTPGTGYTVATAATSNFSGSAIVGLKGWGEEIIFDHITWEVTTSGAIRMAGAVDVLISNCALWDIPGPRTDTGLGGTTNGSPTVTDTAAVSGDLGKAIAGTGIPSGAVITAVNTSTHTYTISQNATATGSGLTFTVGGPAGNMYSFTKSNTGYPCRNIVVRGGRANANTASAGTGFYDFYADSFATNVLIDSFGSWAIPPVISSPASQTTIINQTISGSASPQVTSPVFAATGNTGATAASRYVGATASGAPATGTYAAGDFVIDQTGSTWICTVAGSPGTWVSSNAVPAVWEVQPSDLGMIAWTASPAKASTSVKPSGAFAGVLLMWLFRVPNAGTISKINYSLTVAGGTMANAFVGIYSAGSSATLLAQCTTDQSTNMTGSANAYAATLSSALPVTAGLYRVGLLIGSATTMPTFTAVNGANSAAFTNMGITSGTNFMSVSTGSGQTALPAGPISSGSFSAANTGLPIFVMN